MSTDFFPLVRRRLRPWLVAGLLLVLFAAPASAFELPFADGWSTPVGKAERDGDSIVLRGEPGVEQAVLMFAPVAIDAANSAYLTVAHDGLAPLHELSLYFRSASGEHTVTIPVTTGPVTIRLIDTEGWTGTITELALVYGPAGNIPTLVRDNALRIRAVRFDSAGDTAARFGAVVSQLSRIAPWRGLSNHVLAPNLLVSIAGALAALALVAGVLLRGAARRFAIIAFALAWVFAQTFVWRQWLVLREGAERVTDDRRAAGKPLELDWQLVEIASQLKLRVAGQRERVGFVLRFEDQYTADRLRYHLLPFHARRGEPGTLLADQRCVLELSDRVDEPGKLFAAETAFSPVVLTLTPGREDACRFLSSQP